MESALSNVFLALLSNLPIFITPIYVGLYVSLHYGFYKRVESQRENIRREIIEKWQTSHSDLQSLFDHVELSDIRVIAKPRKTENKSFRRFQIFYIGFSVGIALIAIILKTLAENGQLHSELISFVIGGFLIVYVALTSIIGFMSYFEWEYYDKLSELRENT